MKHPLACSLAIITLISTANIHAEIPADSTNIAKEAVTQPTDSIPAETPAEIIRLTDEDYRRVAEELGVETAAIKAVVDIEAGRAHQGFFAPGKPSVNFDLTMFRRFAAKRKLNLSRYGGSHAEVFARPNARRHGSTQAAQQVRLQKARSIDEVTAIEGTFWGMFQIGGFNWKICGCKDIHEFVERMSRSELEQLELFAAFIKHLGYDKYLRNKNWAAFASRYNGPSYARRGYHTRMAAAYARHKKEEKNSKSSASITSTTQEQPTAPTPKASSEEHSTQADGRD